MFQMAWSPDMAVLNDRIEPVTGSSDWFDLVTKSSYCLGAVTGMNNYFGAAICRYDWFGAVTGRNN